MLILYFEIISTIRRAFSWMTPLLFYVLVVCFFPLASGADDELLNKTAPAIIWIAALLAIIISSSQLFKEDVDEGHLDILLLSNQSLSLITLSKISAHWLTHGLPLVIVSPLLAILLHLSVQQTLILALTLLLGTPSLSLLAGIGAALVVGIRGHGLLLPLLIMPMYLPVLIFGTGITMLVETEQSLNSHFAILGAILLICLAFAPFLTAKALKVGVSN